MLRGSLPALAAAALIAGACAETPATPDTHDGARAPVISEGRWTADRAAVADVESRLRAMLPELESRFGRVDAVPLRADWMAGPGAQAAGTTVFFSDRGNRRLPVQWVPGDPRRQGRTSILYAVEASAPAGLTAADVEGATDRAMGTWASQACSAGLAIEKTSPSDARVDVVHAGFIPLGSTTIGVTIPFIWVDGITGEPTDIDSDGNLDYAFALVFYNSQFAWGIDAGGPIVDLESIVLHEAGHTLGQAHFGKVFGTNANGLFHFAPRAVMNAGYTGPRQALTGTDRAGHCGMFGSWPNN